MGQVYSPERVASGQVPPENGMNQVQAAALFMNFMKSFPATSLHTRLLIPGSTATGQADRRSDIDYLLVDCSEDLPPHRREVQARFIADTMAYARETFHVHFEGQRYSESSLATVGFAVYDALYLDHALKIQDRMPEWSHRKPVEKLRPFAVEPQDMSDPRKATLAGAISLRYMTAKIEGFDEAGDFNPDSGLGLLRFQRALEAPKAYARKMLVISAMEGHEISDDPDVTSKENMKEHTDRMLDTIDKTGRLRHYNDLLAGLDAEYSEVLDTALKTGDMAAYERWLTSNYLPACALARRLAEEYRWYIDDATRNNPDINFWRYGIDICDYFDSDFCMNSSSSEPLGDQFDGPWEKRKEEFSDPVLINMSPQEIDAFLDIVYGQPDRAIFL